MSVEHHLKWGQIWVVLAFYILSAIFQYLTFWYQYFPFTSKTFFAVATVMLGFGVSAAGMYWLRAYTYQRANVAVRLLVMSVAFVVTLGMVWLLVHRQELYFEYRNPVFLLNTLYVLSVFVFPYPRLLGVTTETYRDDPLDDIPYADA